MPILEQHNYRMESNRRNALPFERQYRLGRILGEGGFGRVYAGYRVMDNLPVAIKQISRSKVPSWGNVSFLSNSWCKTVCEYPIYPD